MLLAGALLANLPMVRGVGRLDPGWSRVLRSAALAVILVRAGLGLDPAKLRAMSALVFRLAFLPCLAESSLVAVVSHFILGTKSLSQQYYIAIENNNNTWQVCPGSGPSCWASCWPPSAPPWWCPASWRYRPGGSVWTKVRN